MCCLNISQRSPRLNRSAASIILEILRRDLKVQIMYFAARALKFTEEMFNGNKLYKLFYFFQIIKLLTNKYDIHIQYENEFIINDDCYFTKNVTIATAE